MSVVSLKARRAEKRLEDILAENARACRHPQVKMLALGLMIASQEKPEDKIASLRSWEHWEKTNPNGDHGGWCDEAYEMLRTHAGLKC